MNTATHMLMGMAVLDRRGDARLLIAAALGGLAPDLPAIGMELWAVTIGGYSPGDIYRDLYFSPAWQSALAPWHSFLLWAACLAAGVMGRWRLLQIFAVSALLHLLTDFPLHSDDAHSQFWPLSDWRFESPFSYWNPLHHGWIVLPIEFALVIVLSLLLFRRSKSRGMLAALGVLWLAYVAQLASFALIS